MCRKCRWHFQFFFATLHNTLVALIMPKSEEALARKAAQALEGDVTGDERIFREWKNKLLGWKRKRVENRQSVGAASLPPDVYSSQSSTAVDENERLQAGRHVLVQRARMRQNLDLADAHHRSAPDWAPEHASFVSKQETQNATRQPHVQTIVPRRRNTNASSSRVTSSGNDVLDAYARGYENGRSAGLKEHQELTRTSSFVTAPSTAKQGMAIAREQERQKESRWFKLGWNQAIESVQKNGWRCMNCAPQRRPSIQISAPLRNGVPIQYGRPSMQIGAPLQNGLPMQYGHPMQYSAVRHYGGQSQNGVPSQQGVILQDGVALQRIATNRTSGGSARGRVSSDANGRLWRNV